MMTGKVIPAQNWAPGDVEVADYLTNTKLLWKYFGFLRKTGPRVQVNVLYAPINVKHEGGVGVGHRVGI